MVSSLVFMNNGKIMNMNGDDEWAGTPFPYRVIICGVFIVIIHINNTKHRVYAKNNFYKTCIISNSLFSVFKETVEGESIERN